MLFKATGKKFHNWGSTDTSGLHKSSSFHESYWRQNNTKQLKSDLASELLFSMNDRENIDFQGESQRLWSVCIAEGRLERVMCYFTIYMRVSWALRYQCITVYLQSKFKMEVTFPSSSGCCTDPQPGLQF